MIFCCQVGVGAGMYLMLLLLPMSSSMNRLLPSDAYVPGLRVIFCTKSSYLLVCPLVALMETLVPTGEDIVVLPPGGDIVMLPTVGHVGRHRLGLGHLVLCRWLEVGWLHSHRLCCSPVTPSMLCWHLDCREAVLWAGSWLADHSVLYWYRCRW